MSVQSARHPPPRPPQSLVWWIVLVGLVTASVTASTSEMDRVGLCVDLLKENERVDDSPALASPFLTRNQCEAEKRRELRMPLLEIPRDENDPMSLSIGTKGDGAIVHFKVPFN